MIILSRVLTLVVSIGFSFGSFALDNNVKRTRTANSRLPAQAVSRGPASLTNSISFAEYAADNAANPAMSRKILDHQTAFIDYTPAAVLTAPDADQTAETNGAGLPVPSGTPGAPQAIPGAPAAVGIPAAPGAFSSPGPVH